MAASTGDLNHFRWINYRANVYSISTTRRRRPEILENRAGAGLAGGWRDGLAGGVAGGWREGLSLGWRAAAGDGA
jgi:hypothetical protein